MSPRTPPAAIAVPADSLVMLVGAAGAGKSTLAARLSLATEVVSSDTCRALVADDAGALDASADAFALVHTIADRRLRRGRLTVVDPERRLPEEERHRRAACARREHFTRLAYASAAGRRRNSAEAMGPSRSGDDPSVR